MRSWRRGIVLPLVLLASISCAALPPVRHVEPGDLERLGGEWKGTWSEGPWSGPISLTIDATDRMGEFTFETPSGSARSVSRLSVADGKVVLQGDRGRTILTLHERDSRRALIGEYRYEDGRTGTVELWRP
jgi:hypothetical protein